MFMRTIYSIADFQWQGVIIHTLAQTSEAPHAHFCNIFPILSLVFSLKITIILSRKFPNCKQIGLAGCMFPQSLLLSPTFVKDLLRARYSSGNRAKNKENGPIIHTYSLVIKGKRQQQNR